MKSKLIICSMALLLLCATGCNKNNDAVVVRSTGDNITIGDFTGFTWLMYTEGGIEHLENKDGDIINKSDDGKFYDEDGNEITDYGYGDQASVDAHSNKGSSSNEDVNKAYELDTEKYETDINGNIVEKTVASNTKTKEEALGKDNEGNIIIEDWNDYKEKVQEENNLKPTEWYDGEPDELEEYVGVDGKKVESNQSYETIIYVAGGIPGTINTNNVSIGDTATVSGSITLDSVTFNDYMISTYGDTQLDNDGNAVPADYVSYLNTLECSVSLMVYNDYGDIQQYDAGELYFNESYTLNFDFSGISVPEGYSCMLYVQGVGYNL